MLRFVALSAKFEELDKFSWYQYSGRTKRKLVTHGSAAEISNGSVYGIRPIKGGRFYVILPDLYHVNFTIEPEEMEFLTSRSDEIKKPKLVNVREGRQRAPRNLQGTKLVERRAWDSDYFKPARKLYDESTKGVDLANYQWRKYTGSKPLKIGKTRDLFHVINRGDVFGVRYVAPTKGGIYMDTEGRRWVINPDTWGPMLENTEVLPKTKWPTGKFTVEELKQIRRNNKKQNHREAVSERRQAREIAAAKDREAKEKQQEKERELAKQARAEARKKRLDEKQRLKESAAAYAIKESKRRSTPIVMTDEKLKELLKAQKEEQQKKLKRDVPEVVEFDDDALDTDLDLDTPQEQSGPTEQFQFDPAVDSLSDGEVDPLSLLDQVIDKKRAEARKANLKDLEDDASDEEEEEVDESELEYDDEESDDSEEEEEESADEDTDEQDEESEEDTDTDEEDAGDEDSDEDDEDGADLEDADVEEEPEEEEESAEAEEGDVVVFNKDTTEQREFVVLDIYPLPANNNVTVYKVYDLTNEPSEYHTVRIDTTKKAKFVDSVKIVRKLTPKEFKDVQADVVKFKRSSDPIVS
jgi:hypothetical protein